MKSCTHVEYTEHVPLNSSPQNEADSHSGVSYCAETAAAAPLYAKPFVANEAAAQNSWLGEQRGKQRFSALSLPLSPRFLRFSHH